MPFVTNEHRVKPDLSIPGDRCYVWYRWMMDEWKKERRWTTADKIYRYIAVKHQDKKISQEQLVALDLAWQVFFIRHVIPYEEEAIARNGDIE